MAIRVPKRPYRVAPSPGHIDAYGERTPDRWAVLRTSTGRIVALCPTEEEAWEKATERNAARMLRAA